MHLLIGMVAMMLMYVYKGDLVGPLVCYFMVNSSVYWCKYRRGSVWIDVLTPAMIYDSNANNTFNHLYFIVQKYQLFWDIENIRF